MRTFAALSILCCAVALTATDNPPPSLTPVAREDILFLAHFDAGLLPEIGNAEGAILPTKTTIGGKGFPLGEGRQEAVDLKGIGKCLTFPAEDNYNARQGTIQMWILPKWDLNAHAHCIFFQLVPDQSRRHQCNWRLPILVKPPNQEKLSFGPNATPAPIPTPAKDGWFQLAATWNAEQNYCRLYLNGKLAVEQKYQCPQPPEEIMLGGPKTWNAQAYMDEVRILRRALSDTEIARDFQAQLGGQAFPSPAPSPQDVSITPRHSQAKPAGEFPDCPDVRFTSRFLEHDFVPDGNESKPAWTSIPAVEGFVKRDGTPGEVRTEIRFRHSDSSLYLCAVLWQEMDKMTAQYDQHDMSVWNDDCLEMFLDVPARKTAFW